MRHILLILCSLFLFQTATPAAIAQQAPPLKVATRVLPPFIIKQGGSYAGFSADLWTELASRSGVQFTWLETANVKEILAAVERGEAQVGIAAISITSEREQKFDFSQPMFESGLQILVRNEKDQAFSVSQVLGYFTSGAMPYLLGILALLILIPGHLVWLGERRLDDPVFDRRYLPGIFQAMGWALSAAAGQQNDSPRSRFGRAISIAAIFISLLFLTYWQAELTSSFTVQQLQGAINGPDDLPGKRVGTTKGSTSATYLEARGVKPVEVEAITEAFRALEDGKLDAVVFDAPVLLYHAGHEGLGKVQVVGPVFRKESYGILFPRDSDLRKKINENLLKMREDGSFDRLYEKWFAAGG